MCKLTSNGTVALQIAFDAAKYHLKKNKLTDNKASVPGANKLPVIGKLMSGTFKDDSLSELLVFIAPRIF